MSLAKKLLILATPLILLFAGCAGDQENRIVGTWEMTRMDALPGEFPIEHWEFTADNDLLKYEIDGSTRKFKWAGRWGFTKRNHVNISKFEQDFNGEWQIVVLRKDVLRMILPVEVDNRPAGQVLREFTRAR